MYPDPVEFAHSRRRRGVWVPVLMDNTDYPFEFDEWLKASSAKMSEASDFIGDHPYRHFDGRVSHVALDSNSTLLAERLKDPSKLVKHSFYPFIRRDKKVRRYTRNKTSGKLNIGQKIRPIMYASHADACVYAFYSYMLKQRYETAIAGTPLDESVVAYRKILRSDGSGRGKSNIEFASEVSLLARSQPKCAVLCLDVTKFFDTMSHEQVKQTWQDIIGVSPLPVGHYAVFKAITKFRYVTLQSALQRLGYGFVRRGKFFFAKNKKRFGILCTPVEFRKRIDPKANSIVHKNMSGKGIPQGSPISDILANIYLKSFDEKILGRLSGYDFGYYRRYSDDILIICPEDKAQDIYDFALSSIKNDHLAIKPTKSEAVVVDNSVKTVTDITFSLTRVSDHSSYARKAFQYLGFEIDAIDMHLRSGTIAAHYRRAKQRAKAGIKASGKTQKKLSSKRKNNKSNRSRWQYFINSEKRTGSSRVGRQYQRALKRVKGFSGE